MQSRACCRAIDAVSSAEPSLLSTANTAAPSCAKRSTVARPLPIPSPGDCPAPTTMATLSLRRMPPSIFSLPTFDGVRFYVLDVRAAAEPPQHRHERDIAQRQREQQQKCP